MGILRRQRIVLSVLREAGRSLPRTVLTKLAFLLRFETGVQHEHTFYDFVPYRFGPFSFGLYHELGLMEKHGYIVSGPEHISVSGGGEAHVWNSCPESRDPIAKGISYVVRRYGAQDLTALLKYIYGRYTWYALRSELTHLLPDALPPEHYAPISVYTLGYEGKSVDEFFRVLLQVGINSIVDVRANAISRKYGFAGTTLSRIAQHMGMQYRHMPALGIPSESRRQRTREGTQASLFREYERELLPLRTGEIGELTVWFKERPSVLVCMEGDAQRCHRARLARALAQQAELPIVHL